ncbi:hypothetical protein F7234_03965 [Pseudomonas putida]|uniref:hypothetical protein n=1 Tax=Pseudomonas putida TaxID=303 RepID=UPI00125F086C|nr:hypothetical protein [Pseudomonas putida]KAB5626300.1 hypothetical protein F7234_03965 [Pseudomonas putida]
MPWYRQGTVAVTAGQVTVIGTGTSFSANVRVGDAFLGPDGTWYEVTNVASDSVLSILPAYRGTTASGVTYSVTPVQGYQKDLSDRVRAIIEQWGDDLTNLGAVASEDVVPVEKGGTGGTTAETARSGLGLGAVAVEAIVPIAKGGTGGNSLVTARNNLGLKTAALADILGTVSQSGGTPTGAIIERGSNANGNYVKYADGTMICTGVSAAGVVTGVAFGNIYTNNATSFTFPAAFAAAPVVAPAVSYVSGGPVWGGVDSISTTGCSIRLFSGGSNGGGQPKYIAVGRWFA